MLLSTTADGALVVLALGLAVLAAAWLLPAGGRRRGFVLCRDEQRAWLRRLGLARPEQFLDLDAPIISGHPGRQVARLALGKGGAARVVFLKREERTPWTARLGNLLAGFGWVSRPVREARLLQALAGAGLPGPRWLAAGEDGRGRAFLLLEEARGAVALPEALAALSERRRCQVAARLGRMLARMHQAGFCHRDLYAKHVLVGPADSVTLLDWQRARHGARVPRSARIRDLATLHATLPGHLAGPRPCVAFLRAYAGREERHGLARAVRKESRRLLARRHVREKRQPPAPDQVWACLDGQALCITPAFRELYPAGPPGWLALEQQPLPPAGAESRRRVVLPGGRQGLLLRRRGWPGLPCLFRAWRGRRPIISPHQRQANLLWRLQRHGIPTPRVLACGQRCLSPWCVDSFLLVEPLPDTAPLLPWLAEQGPAARAALLEQVGRLLARLHEACCYLAGARLLVWQEGVALEGAEGVAALRRPSARRARGDLARLRRCLDEAEWESVRRGYASHMLPSPPAPLLRSGAAPAATTRINGRAREPGCIA